MSPKPATNRKTRIFLAIGFAVVLFALLGIIALTTVQQSFNTAIASEQHRFVCLRCGAQKWVKGRYFFGYDLSDRQGVPMSHPFFSVPEASKCTHEGIVVAEAKYKKFDFYHLEWQSKIQRLPADDLSGSPGIKEALLSISATNFEAASALFSGLVGLRLQSNKIPITNALPAFFSHDVELLKAQLQSSNFASALLLVTNGSHRIRTSTIHAKPSRAFFDR
jgi:hypothetical protein